MKKFIVISCILAVVALALLAGCAGSGSSDPVVAEAEECFKCHTGNPESTLGNNILGAQAQYANSGHYNGPRIYAPAYITANTGEIFEFEGSNAMYTNGNTCSKCHTHQGFVSYVASPTGETVSVSAASQPGCFTCHGPHETGDFTVRKNAAEILVENSQLPASSISYDRGLGNLCVTCHKSRTAATTGTSPGITATATTIPTGPSTTTLTPPLSKTQPSLPGGYQSWRSSSGPHHGPQADFLKGTNYWVYTLLPVTYTGDSPHYSTSAGPDSCVTCHMYGPSSGNLSGSLELGGHGMYLTGDVHGSQKDIVAVCKTCHASGGPGLAWPSASTATTFESSNHKVKDVLNNDIDVDGDSQKNDILVEIDGLKKKLAIYFGTGTNFATVTFTQNANKEYTGYTVDRAIAGRGAIVEVDPSTGAVGGDFNPDDDLPVPTTTWEWHKNWEFNPYSAPTPTSIIYPYLNQWQSRSFWNFKLFMEDRSGGVHNPKFAAQILYDAIKNLNDNGAGITLGTRP